MALSDLQVGGPWSQMVTSIELHVGVVHVLTQIRHGGPDLGLQHGHLDGLGGALREHRRAVQAGCSLNSTNIPLLSFISLRVVSRDTVVALRQAKHPSGSPAPPAACSTTSDVPPSRSASGTCWQRCQWQPARQPAATGRCHALDNAHYSRWQAGCLAAVPLGGKDPDISKIMSADRGFFAGARRGAPTATGAAQPPGELEGNPSVLNRREFQGLQRQRCGEGHGAEAKEVLGLQTILPNHTVVL